MKQVKSARPVKSISSYTLSVMAKLAKSGNYTANDVLSLISEVRRLQKFQKNACNHKLVKRKNPPSTSEFYYDIAYGGYLKPKDFADDPSTIKAIENAVQLLMDCEKLCDAI